MKYGRVFENFLEISQTFFMSKTNEKTANGAYIVTIEVSFKYFRQIFYLFDRILVFWWRKRHWFLCKFIHCLLDLTRFFFLIWHCQKLYKNFDFHSWITIMDLYRSFDISTISLVFQRSNDGAKTFTRVNQSVCFNYLVNKVQLEPKKTFLELGNDSIDQR